MSEDLRDVPSRGDQAVDRAEYIRLLEAEVARLEALNDVAERKLGEWRDRGAEVERLRLDLIEACRGGAVLARERNEAEAKLSEMEELGSVKSALRLRAERQELVKTKLALQAKVARLREAGGHLRGFAAGTDLGKAYIEAWDTALRESGEPSACADRAETVEETHKRWARGGGE